MKNKYYIIQSNDDWWTIGMEYQENGRTNIGRAPGMEEPFVSLTCFDSVLSGSFNAQRDGVKQQIFLDGRSAMFPTKNMLVAALKKVGFTEGNMITYNCREIIKYDAEKAKEEESVKQAQERRSAKKKKNTRTKKKATPKDEEKPEQELTIRDLLRLS